MKTKVLTVSALSSALATIVLIFGTVFADLFDLVAVIVAPMVLAMPLYYNSVKGAILSTLCAGILALMLTGFGSIATNLVYISYFAFFGFFPIVKYCTLTKRWNKYLLHTICALWFAISVVVIYLYYVNVLGFGINLIIPLPAEKIPVMLFFGAIPLYFLVDAYIYACQIFMFRMLNRIVKN